MEERGLRLDELTREHVQAFFHARRQAGYTHLLTPRSLSPILGYLERTEIISMPETTVSQPGPFDELLEQYGVYLLQERGLTLPITKYYGHVARQFLCAYTGDRGKRSVGLGDVRARDVTALVLQQTHVYSTGTAKGWASALKSWLRFLHVKGKLGQDLTGAVPAIAGWRMTGLPKAIEPAQVKQLLRSCDRRTHMGRRDYAVILLMVRLGLRACEVTRLEFDDIDWGRAELVIRGKGGHEDLLPLPSDVGEALAAYLRFRRSSIESRRIFLRVRAPRGPLSKSGVLAIVRHRFLKLGLPPMGAHRLRHTTATQMLRKGGSLDEIAHVLRHRSHDTTAIYAKVDRTALRQLAQPWPGGA
jgi:site-specific recombinase XerD